MRKENANFQNNPLNIFKIALKENFTVFIFCLALKKKCILRSRKDAQPCLAHSAMALNELNLAVASL
jgi:hypothetical protein